jgi:hypothetical protein
MDISVDFTKAHIEWADDGGRLNDIQVRSVNLGNSPAFKALIWPSLRIAHPITIQDVRKECNGHSGLDRLGTTVFSKDNTGADTRWGLGVASNEIDTFRGGVAKLNRVTPGEITFVSLAIIACVRYRIFGDNLDHYTGRVFEIGKLANEPDGARFVSLEIGKDVPAGHLILRREFEGDYSD